MRDEVEPFVVEYFYPSAFRLHPSSLRPRRAARSARLPVAQETAGSNPAGGACRRNGAVRKTAKRRSSNLRDLRVRLPPAPLAGLCSSRRPVKPLSEKQVRWTTRGSIPSQPTWPALLAARPKHGSFVYRYRTSALQAGEAGSTPARAAVENDQVVELADTRRSERRAPHGALGVRLSPWSLQASSTRSLPPLGKGAGEGERWQGLRSLGFPQPLPSPPAPLPKGEERKDAGGPVLNRAS